MLYKLFIIINEIINYPYDDIAILIRDFHNRIKYGKEAPLFAEKIWVDATKCKYAITGLSLINGLEPASGSGRIIDIWPSREKIPVEDVEIINICLKHWRDRLSWDEVGAYKRMEKLIARLGAADHCSNMEHVVKRYTKLDEVFTLIKKEGCFKTSRELDPRCYKEMKSIPIHIGPGGNLYLCNGGYHRFAIALAQKKVFPARIGFVYKNAIPFLKELRKKN